MGGARPLAPSATLGGLRLLRKLGRGGMGEVWLARDEALGVDRAVKVLLPERAVDPALRVRFTAEARTLAALGDVPGLVRVHAAGEDSLTGLPYFVMDAHLLAPDDIRRLCVGRLGLTPVAADRIAACPIGISGESSRPVPNPFTLDNALGGGAEENARALPERAVLTIAREIAAALDSLHRRKPPVVHRDLKPSNLLFSGNGSLLLADFGIAKVLDPDHPGPTLTGIQPGSHRYAAPEQREGRPATPAADWYALGVVLYRALTGSFPEWGEDFPTDPARPHFSPLWKPLLSQLLAPDPARRLDDSTQFLDALDAIERSLSPRPRHRHARAGLIWFLAILGCLGALGTLCFRSKGGSEDSVSHAENAEVGSSAKDSEDETILSHAEPVRAEPSPGEVRTVLLPGGVPLDLVWVPPGTFTMGLSEKERAPCETPSGMIPGDDNAFAPPRSVSVGRGFWLAKTELTQEQYAKIEYGEDGLPTFGADYPQAFFWRMAERTVWSLNRLGTGFTFRIPTAAEWEWAARGGPRGGGHAWSGSDDPDEVAWTANSWPPKDQPKPAFGWPAVATRRPNELGLFDMSGSFAEWCSDRYVPPVSAGFTLNGRSAQTEYRVVRGGSINTPAAYCRNGSFSSIPTDDMVGGLFGLRVAADALP